MQHGEISKQDRKAWNRHVRERNVRRQEASKSAGLAAGMLFLMAFALVSIDMPNAAGVAFIASIFFAFVSWVTDKLYGQSKKEQGH